MQNYFDNKINLSLDLVKERLDVSYIEKYKDIFIDDNKISISNFLIYHLETIECFDRQRTKKNDQYEIILGNIDKLFEMFRKNDINDTKINMDENFIFNYKNQCFLAFCVNNKINGLDELLSRERNIYTNIKIDDTVNKMNSIENKVDEKLKETTNHLEKRIEKQNISNLTILSLFTAVISIIISSITTVSNVSNSIIGNNIPQNVWDVLALISLGITISVIFLIHMAFSISRGNSK